VRLYQWEILKDCFFILFFFAEHFSLFYHYI
jgi:hypothetical protein